MTLLPCNFMVVISMPNQMLLTIFCEAEGFSSRLKALLESLP